MLCDGEDSFAMRDTDDNENAGGGSTKIMDRKYSWTIRSEE